MSAAPAPQRAPAKRPVAKSEGANEKLMREMGSTSGSDPMPPDQYLYFLSPGAPPMQRILALVRATTIRYRHRSPHCVDENGRELRLADLERKLGMDHGNFMRAWKEAVSHGLVKLGDPRHPQRIYLRGSVPQSKSYDGGEEKGSVCTDTYRPLTSGQLKLVAGWPPERQDRFYAEYDALVKHQKDTLAAAVAAARAQTRPLFEAVFERWEILPEAKKKAVSVQTPAASVSVQTPNRESVPTLPSLLTEKEERAAPPNPPSGDGGRPRKLTRAERKHAELAQRNALQTERQRQDAIDSRRRAVEFAREVLNAPSGWTEQEIQIARDILGAEA